MVTRIIRFFNVIMAALVSGTIFGIWIGYNMCSFVFTNSNSLKILLIAAFFLTLSGLITKVGNQPINSIVMTWDMHNPPTNWIELRDQWWAYHKIRTLTAFIGLCLIVWTSIKQD